MTEILHNIHTNKDSNYRRLFLEYNILKKIQLSISILCYKDNWKKIDESVRTNLLDYHIAYNKYEYDNHINLKPKENDNKPD